MSAGKFFITGLPRSRTAWMSAFMTTGETLCLHEPCIGMSDISEIGSIWHSDFYKHVGVSDSGIGFFTGWILDNIAPRTVIIDRDLDECEQSLVELGFGKTNGMELLQAELAKYREHPLVMWVPFEALNEKRTMQKIFWHLMPGIAFDEARYEEFAKLHIEARVAHTVERVQKHQTQAAHMFRDILPHIKAKR